jgi:hypothetical protein
MPLVDGDVGAREDADHALDLIPHLLLLVGTEERDERCAEELDENGAGDRHDEGVTFGPVPEKRR